MSAHSTFNSYIKPNQSQILANFLGVLLLWVVEFFNCLDNECTKCTFNSYIKPNQSQILANLLVVVFYTIGGCRIL